MELGIAFQPLLSLMLKLEVQMNIRILLIDSWGGGYLCVKNVSLKFCSVQTSFFMWKLTYFFHGPPKEIRVHMTFGFKRKKTSVQS